MGSPVIFGANNTTTGLQSAFLMGNGAYLNSNGPKNYLTYGNFENNATTGWSAINVGTVTNSVPAVSGNAGVALANGQYYFTITSGNATVGATYTNNAQTFTVVNTIAAQTKLVCTGTGAPAASGTLTKSAGTGDATITFSLAYNSSFNGNTLSVVTGGSQLAGTYSLSYADSGTVGAGESLASAAVTIDAEDQARVLTYRFFYKPSVNGSSMNFSGTSSNTWQVLIYDVSAAQWIQPAGTYGMTQLTGIGYATGTFQTTATSTQYQFFIVAINASSGGAVTMLYDDFYLGPQPTSQAPTMSDWVTTRTFTPNNFGTVTLANYLSRRIGDTLEATISFTPGTLAAATASISLPSGLSIDTTKMPSNAAGTVVGTFSGASGSGNQNLYYSSSSSGTADGGVVFYDGSTSGSLFFTNLTSTTALVKSNANAQFNAGPVTMEFKVPIVGWSANAVSSADTDTRLCAAVITGTPPNANTALNPIIFPTVTKDTFGAYSTGTGQFTAPTTGFYSVSFYITSAQYGSTTVGYVYVNGSQAALAGQGGSAGTVPGSATVYALAGQTIDVRASTTSTSGAAASSLSITRASGPAVVQATESVNARWYASSTTVSGALATVVWTTKDFDSHAAMASGLYTIPVSGKYQVNCGLGMTGTYALNSLVTMELQKNSTAVTRTKTYAGAVVTQLSGYIDDIISCVAGDVLRIQVSNSCTSPVIVTSNFENYISIARVGN